MVNQSKYDVAVKRKGIVEIPWIGYEYFPFNVFKEILEDDLSVSVNTDLLRADVGLENIMSKQSPVIIMRDVIAPGNLELPPEIQLCKSMGPRVVQHLISQIRKSELNSQTPIIVSAIPVKGYVNIQDYFNVGATHVIDLSKIDSVPYKELVRNVQKYL